MPMRLTFAEAGFVRGWMGLACRAGALTRAMGRRGTAALEFAMASPLLIIMLAGAADYGVAQFYKTSLANAVAAGTQYAFLTGPSVTRDNLIAVITDAMHLPADASKNLSWNILNPPAKGYCVTGSAPTMSAATVGSTCSDGSTAGTYVVISVTYTNTSIIGSMVSWPLAITESATVRLN